MFYLSPGVMIHGRFVYYLFTKNLSVHQFHIHTPGRERKEDTGQEEEQNRKNEK